MKCLKQVFSSQISYHGKRTMPQNIRLSIWKDLWSPTQQLAGWGNVNGKPNLLSLHFIYYNIYVESQTWLSIKRIRKFVKQTLCFLFYFYCVTHTHTGFSFIYIYIYIYMKIISTFFISKHAYDIVKQV